MGSKCTQINLLTSRIQNFFSNFQKIRLVSYLIGQFLQKYLAKFIQRIKNPEKNDPFRRRKLPKLFIPQNTLSVPALGAEIQAQNCRCGLRLEEKR